MARISMYDSYMPEWDSNISYIVEDSFRFRETPTRSWTNTRKGIS